MRPKDFGLPEYEEYRKHSETQAEVQLEVIEFLAYSEARFACAAAPVGIGKSLVAVTLFKMLQKRTAIVVPFKGLEDQYALSPLGKHMQDIRGRDNYSCGDYADLTCKGGATMGCLYCKGNGCEYEVEVGKAKNQDCVLTNYDYWLNKNDRGGGLERNEKEAELFGANPFEMLILDEGDVAADKVASYLAVKIYEREIQKLAEGFGIEAKDLGDEIQEWKKFAADSIPELEALIRTTGMELAYLGKRATRKHVEELHRLERLKDKMERIKGIEDDWVLEKKIGLEWGRRWDFDVIWPGRYTEQYLFQWIPKVVIMSGTLTPKDLAQMGVRKEEYEYRQWARIFPGERQPIYSLPPRKRKEDGSGWVNINLKKSTPEEDKRIWLGLIDKIIEGRLDRKGLLQVTCLEPKTRILTADLKWVPAGSIRTGEALLAFDEHAPKGKGYCRSWRKSIVERAELIKCECVKVTLEDGRSIICSKNHSWLTHGGKTMRWVTAANLRYGQKNASHLMGVIEPWEVGSTWKHGYLAAAFDGEGHITQRMKSGLKNRRGLRLTFTQNDNCMLRAVENFLVDLGFRYRRNGNAGREVLHVNVHRKENALRFLGEVRPTRLLRKFDIAMLGKFSLLKRFRVIDVEDVGRQTVAFIQTTTGTFIAEGLASHNSYEYQRYLLDNSRYGELMIANSGDPDDEMPAAKVAEEFYNSAAPKLLVSPSFGRGWDFSGSRAEYTIICKVPFIPTQSKVMQARLERDERYADHLAMKKIEQGAGRVMRSEEDRGEVFLVDGHFGHFLNPTGRNQGLAQRWFLEAVRRVLDVPQAPPRLERD
jgi:Rad3-related DNA helicase